MNKSKQIQKTAFIFAVLVFGLIVFISSYFFYKYERQSIYDTKYQELKNISHFKTEQITKYLKSQSSMVNVVSTSNFFIDVIESYLNNPEDLQLKIKIVNQLKTILKENGLENILLSDTEGNLLLSVNSSIKSLSGITLSIIEKSVENEEIVFSDLYYCNIQKKILFDFAAPIKNSNSKVFSMIIFSYDPATELFPLIDYYPEEYNTLETIILRKTGDSVLFLNDTRLSKNSAFKLKIPLSRINVPSVKAALGYVGQFKGVDYRNEKVFSEISKLPSPEWIMVTKIDESEINVAVLNKAYNIILLSVGLILISSIGLMWFYNQKQKNIYEELYKKETDLWQQREKFKVTIDGLGEGIILTDTNGAIKYMNKRAEELTGWGMREAQGRKLSEVYSVMNEETGQKENNIFNKVIKHGLVKELANHTILISKNREELPVMDTGAPIFNIDGSLHGIAISFRDETEKRNQLKQVKESEYRLRSTLDNMLEGCQILNKELVYLYINKAAERHNRRPASELIGKHYTEMWPGIEKTEVFQIIKRCIDESIPSQFENEFVFPNGNTGYFELSIEPIPEGVFILSVDVTARKRVELEKINAERELHKSNQKIKRIISNLKDLLWSASLDGSNVIEVNNSFEEFYGRKKEEFFSIPNLWLESVHVEDREIALKSAVELREKGIAEAEYRIIRPDGSIRWILDRKSIVKDDNNQPIEMGGLAKDITEQKIAVQEIVNAKEKAEEMNRLRTNFFANMSHELRTPFVGIFGFAELLSQNLEGTEAAELADGIVISSRRLMETLDQILVCAKLEFEERVMKNSWVDIRSLIQRVYKNYIRMAETKQLEFKEVINFNNLSTYIDEELLTQIVSNLVNNAIKYTASGTVTIIADIIKSDSDQFLKIVVKDTGTGIPKDKHNVIFEEFRQVSEGFGRAFEGTGLGLSIVKNNTKLLGGTIILESEVGIGSSFILKVPLVKSMEFSSENQIQNDFTIEKNIVTYNNMDSDKRILYVEDDKNAQQIVVRILSNKYEIIVAETADNAIKIVNEVRFDAILMDINLGRGIDGVELSQWIKKIPGYERVPIIAITAFARMEDRKDFLSSGMDYYISKPFMQKELLDLLDNVFLQKQNKQ